MIKRLKFKVTFAETGKTFEADHTFEKGMTAITGPNEQGKSLRLEMIRYALFGSKALRAPMSTIYELSVELDFSIKNKSYSVDRTLSGAKFYEGKKLLASGKKPVDENIKFILGYDLEVFDTANACLQGKVEEFSDKTPTERKKMVDRLIGLDAIDDAIKQISEVIKESKTIQDTLRHTLIEIEEPEEPQVSSNLEGKIKELRNEVTELERAEAIYSVRVERPVKPEQPSDYNYIRSLDVDEYRTAVPRLAALETQLRGLSPEPLFTQEEIDVKKAKLDEYDEWLQLKHKDNEFPAPHYDLPIGALEEIKELFSLNKKIQSKLDLGDQIEAHKKDLITCPECGHEFALMSELVDSLVDRMKQYIDLPDELYELNYEYDKVQSSIDRIKNRQEANLPELPPQPDTEGYTVSQYTKDCMALQDVGRRCELTEEINEVKLVIDDYPQDFLTKVSKCDKFDEENSLFNSLWTDYQVRKQTQDEALKAISQYNGARETLKQYEEELKVYEDYKSNYKVYEQIKNKNKNTIDRISEVGSTMDFYSRAREGLKSLKPKIKGFLVPSLNTAASRLLDSMTNGARSKIVVNEDFDIMVDGQSIDTLSGSAKAVANLSLRIGLGTILTNKVFSVFLGDEIDASMDSDRAAYTAACMRNLKNIINQIVLVSHHDPEADNYIKLGEDNQ